MKVNIAHLMVDIFWRKTVYLKSRVVNFKWQCMFHNEDNALHQVCCIPVKLGHLMNCKIASLESQNCTSNGWYILLKKELFLEIQEGFSTLCCQTFDMPIAFISYRFFMHQFRRKNENQKLKLYCFFKCNWFRNIHLEFRIYETFLEDQNGPHVIGLVFFTIWNP